LTFAQEKIAATPPNVEGETRRRTVATGMP
jgi:hypothetical protein